MILTERRVRFKEYEKKIQEISFEIGRSMLRTALEACDAELSRSRDKSVYHHKGKRKTVIKTILGEVEYERVLYEVRIEGQALERVYLLDEAMGLQGKGKFSELMRDMIVESCCEGTYRNAAHAVSELTGQAISHTSAWNVVQSVGREVGENEETSAKAAKQGKGSGAIEAALLFEEQDGIYLKLQGKDRKNHGVNKEMKVGIAYDGAIKTGKGRYELSNKVACANFESARKFVSRKEGVIAEVYNVDEIEMRFLNGDGASWIRRSQTDETVHFQLSQFHRNKAVTQHVSDPESRNRIMNLLHSKDIALLLHVIEAEAHSTDDEEERDHYMELLRYFENNKDGLVPCHRRGLELPEPPEGKEYRSMGAMESNIFTIIGNRMKGRRACWSIEGGNNLARLLCLKHTKRLTGALGKLSSYVLPERYSEEILVKTSAADIAETVGKGYNGFKQMLIPSEIKWLKDIARVSPVYSV
jgi:hypothetical protein